MRIQPFLSALTAALLTAAPALGQVNIKNGNYYVTYTDAEVPDLKIERTYNSKTVGSSIFGYGWGWIFDTHLVPLGDGGLMLHNYGGGSRTEFAPAFPDPDALSRSIEAIIQARVQAGWSVGPDEVAAFRTELRNNSDRRSNHWSRYLQDGTLEPPRHPVGTQWAASEISGFETVTRSEDGYALKRSSASMRFDEAGKLRWLEQGSNEYTISYNEHGYVQRIETPGGSVAHFDIGSEGLIERVVIRRAQGSEQAATYRHDEGGDLIEHIDAEGSRYRYSYDDAHNMTRIDYEDGSARVIRYDPSSLFTTRIDEPNGTIREYEYFGDNDLFGTRITVTSPSGGSTRSEYEWEIRTTDSGRRWNYRTVQDIGGVRTETTYNECCNLPVLIRRNGGETRFAYDARGNMTRKANAKEVIVNAYDLEVNKITRVERWTADEARMLETFSFSYSADGNLTRAEHSDGRWVELTYSETDRIVEMATAEQTLAFEYNAIGKPTQIAIEGVGAIHVEYDEDGEIERVNSPDGAAVSMEVTSAFQELLNLTKPSGVNLNM